MEQRHIDGMESFFKYQFRNYDSIINLNLSGVDDYILVKLLLDEAIYVADVLCDQSIADISKQFLGVVIDAGTNGIPEDFPAGSINFRFNVEFKAK